MRRRFLCVRLIVLGKMAVAVYLLLFVVMHSRLKDFHVLVDDNQTSTQKSVRLFVPRCFRTALDLALQIGDKIWRLEIKCVSNTQPTILKRRTPLLQGAYQMLWNQSLDCLKNFVKSYCYMSKGHRVPNIIHYVWLGRDAFRADNFISTISALRYQQPCAILFHGKEAPTGPYWDLLLAISQNVIHVVRDAPIEIFGKMLSSIQHKSDIVRLEALSELGGIYLDIDQLLMKNVSELMNESFVMSHEGKKNLANSMILSEPKAQFNELWYGQYQWYNAKKWGYHSTFVPFRLAKKFPSAIKIVGNRFINPDLDNITAVYTKHYNLSTNYGLHLYARFFPALLKLPQVLTWNSTMGDVWRSALYGKPELFVCPESATP